MRKPWKEFEMRAKAFADSHAVVHISDEAFVSGTFDNPSELQANIAVILRRVLARDCGVIPEQLGYAESTKEIECAMGASGFLGWLLGGPYGYDFQSLFPNLLEELDQLVGKCIPGRTKQLRVLGCFSTLDDPRFVSNPTFGNWIRLATQEIQEVLEDAGVLDEDFGPSGPG